MMASTPRNSSGVTPTFSAILMCPFSIGSMPLPKEVITATVASSRSAYVRTSRSKGQQRGALSGILRFPEPVQHNWLSAHLPEHPKSRQEYHARVRTCCGYQLSAMLHDPGYLRYLLLSVHRVPQQGFVVRARHVETAIGVGVYHHFLEFTHGHSVI